MRKQRRAAPGLVALSALAALAASLAPGLAPPAAADPDCQQTGGAAAVGGSTTICSTPGNVQINAMPAVPAYPYPWDDEFYGPALMIGGFGVGAYRGGVR